MAVALLSLSIVPASAIAQTLQGDCNADGEVTIDELVRCAIIFNAPSRTALCPACDQNNDSSVSIGEVVGASSCFLNPVIDDNCRAVGAPTATTVPSTPTPTASPSATPVIPSPTPTEVLQDTPTAAPSPTATASQTPSESMAECNNGFLESGETCESCSQDCVVKACTATLPITTFRVNFSYPEGQVPTSTTILLGYRSDRASIPGMGNVTTVRQRVKNLPTNAFPGYNDLDYAFRVVVSRGTGLPTGRLFTVDFDSCQGAPAPSLSEFGCTIEGCGGSAGTVSGCTCEVVVP